MIKSFKDRETESVFLGRVSPDFPAEIQSTARRKLRQLDNAVTLDDLRIPPGNRLEKLKGEREARYSVRINDQWRIRFTWEPDGPGSVEIVDYH
jgi:proteic killer suppression protein